MRIIESRDLPEESSRPSYFVGLDLGQAADFSAIAVMECQVATKDTYTFHCRHLQRWKLRTPYPTIVADTVQLMNSPEIRQGTRALLAVDATGVGAPVVDLFKRERFNAKLAPIQIVGGSTVSKENGVTRVPKRDLVSTVQVYLQNKRLKISSQLDLAETLTRELQNFQVKITDSENDTYGAWREGTHDDLVLAASLALWAGTEIKPSVFYLSGSYSQQCW
jgi:hypothetical protein